MPVLVAGAAVSMPRRDCFGDKGQFDTQSLVVHNTPIVYS